MNMTDIPIFLENKMDLIVKILISVSCLKRELSDLNHKQLHYLHHWPIFVFLSCNFVPICFL